MSDKKDDRKSGPNGFSYGHSGNTKEDPKVNPPAKKTTESPKGRGR